LLKLWISYLQRYWVLAISSTIPEQLFVREPLQSRGNLTNPSTAPAATLQFAAMPSDGHSLGQAAFFG
jgi:hypothetical protein